MFILGKKISSFVLCVVIMLSLCCCGKETAEDNALKVDGKRAEKIKAEGSKISFIVPGFDGTDKESDYFKAIKELEDTYGKKVKVLSTVGDQTWNQKVAAQVASGDPIDVFFVNVEQYLSMYQKGYMRPVDEYIDLENRWHNRSVMDDYVKFDGKYYAGCVSATPYVMYYNRDLLSANGFDPDEPKNLYNDGKWTWDEFKKIASECSDEDAGITGLENMFDEVFEASNKSGAVKYENGKYLLNIMSEEMRNTLEMVKDIFASNPICGSGYVTGQNKFLKGKSVFHGAYAYEDATFTELKANGKIKIDYGVTAFPYGPDNSDLVNFGNSTGFAIAKGTDAPYTAGMLIDLIGKYSTSSSEAKQKNVLKENAKLYKELSENLYIPSYTDGILQEGYGAFYLLYYVRQGDDINSVRATYQTEYQKMIDDANALIK